jgi:hypothetical protein
MNDWVSALRGVEARISERKGQFALFAAFLPAEAADQWDLVVSAPWARRDDRAVLDLISDELAASVSENDVLLLARIVVVEPWHPDVQEINSRFDVEHGLVSVANEEHFGYLVERGFIITSKDYWLYIKRLFPADAQYAFFVRDGDLRIRVSWYLNDDSHRPHKPSKNIILAISEEALEDYLYGDHPGRLEAQEKVAGFIAERLRGFDPKHDTPAHMTPPREQWSITTSLFRQPRLAAG